MHVKSIELEPHGYQHSMAQCVPVWRIPDTGSYELYIVKLPRTWFSQNHVRDFDLQHSCDINLWLAAVWTPIRLPSICRLLLLPTLLRYVVTRGISFVKVYCNTFMFVTSKIHVFWACARENCVFAAPRNTFLIATATYGRVRGRTPRRWKVLIKCFPKSYDNLP
jgi:hypothetical protein